MLFASHSTDSNALVKLIRVARSQGMLVLMFLGDFSSFTDGSDVRINDFGKTLASESTTFPRKHTFGNGFTVTGITCNVSPHTCYLDVMRTLK